MLSAGARLGVVELSDPTVRSASDVQQAAHSELGLPELLAEQECPGQERCNWAQPAWVVLDQLVRLRAVLEQIRATGTAAVVAAGHPTGTGWTGAEPTGTDEAGIGGRRGEAGTAGTGVGATLLPQQGATGIGVGCGTAGVGRSMTVYSTQLGTQLVARCLRTSGRRRRRAGSGLFCQLRDAIAQRGAQGQLVARVAEASQPMLRQPLAPGALARRRLGGNGLFNWLCCRLRLLCRRYSGVSALAGGHARRPWRGLSPETRSAWASSIEEEWLFTPIPRPMQRSKASLFVSPSSRELVGADLLRQRSSIPFSVPPPGQTAVSPELLSSHT